MLRCLSFALLLSLAAFAAADDVSASPEAAAKAAESAPEQQPQFDIVTIKNQVAEVAISTQRASIERFSLLEIHPTKLPKPLREKAGSKTGTAIGAHENEPLAVLGPFHGHGADLASNRHNWLHSGGYLLTGGVNQTWTKGECTDSTAVLTYSVDQKLFYRLTYTMDKDAPRVSATLEIRNQGAEAVTLKPRVIAINGIHQDYPPGEAVYLSVVHHQNGVLKADSFPGADKSLPTFTGPLDYVGLKSRFFAALWSPGPTGIVDQAPEAAAVDKKPKPTSEPGEHTEAPAASKPEVMSGPYSATVYGYAVASPSGQQPSNVAQAQIEVNYPATELKPDKTFSQNWSLTITGMDSKTLSLLDENERKVEYTSAYYKFFKILVKALNFLLDGIVLVVRNYGVALVMLTLLIKLVLHRTTFKQQESMLKMQKLMPELKYMQEQYKGDRQKIAMKQMELYKKHGVNPLGGCLPIFIQMPIFIALYQCLSNSANMRGQGFLWVNDLTLPDQLLSIGTLPFLGTLTINPLPLMYIAVTIWMSLSQKMPPNADPQQEQMQKMMRWIPVVFGVIFYNMPAGLVLYFTANAIASTIEIKLVKRKLGMNH